MKLDEDRIKKRVKLNIIKSSMIAHSAFNNFRSNQTPTESLHELITFINGMHSGMALATSLVREAEQVNADEFMQIFKTSGIAIEEFVDLIYSEGSIQEKFDKILKDLNIDN